MDFFFFNQKPSDFSHLGLPQDPKGEGNGLESTYEHLQNNFQKGLKTGFLAPIVREHFVVIESVPFRAENDA